MKCARRLSLLIALGVVAFAVGIRAQTSKNVVATHFASVDVLVDPHETALAAYQVEFVANAEQVTLVGIEGGEHTAFKQPPYYDPKALAGNRVILAALNTGMDLPKSKTRVARLHLRISGADDPNMTAKLIVAASGNDQPIAADVSVAQGAKP